MPQRPLAFPLRWQTCLAIECRRVSSTTPQQLVALPLRSLTRLTYTPGAENRLQLLRPEDVHRLLRPGE